MRLEVYEKSTDSTLWLIILFGVISHETPNNNNRNFIICRIKWKRETMKSLHTICEEINNLFFTFVV